MRKTKAQNLICYPFVSSNSEYITWMYIDLIFTAHQRSVGGDVFSGVCQLFCSQGGPRTRPWPQPSTRQEPSSPYYNQPQLRGHVQMCSVWTSSYRTFPLLDVYKLVQYVARTVGKRIVSIRLKCLLVLSLKHFSYETYVSMTDMSNMDPRSVILFLIFVVWYILGPNLNPENDKMKSLCGINKLLPMVVLIIAVFFADETCAEHAQMLSNFGIGLIVSTFGDLGMIKMKYSFVPNMALISIAQIFYIRTFMQTTFGYDGVLFVIIGSLVSLFFTSDVKKFVHRICCFAFWCLRFVIWWSTCGRWHHSPSLQTLVGATGGALFVVSGLLVFKSQDKSAETSVGLTVTYYLAQLLLTISVVTCGEVLPHVP